MHECCYFSRSPEILADLQFVFEKLQNFLCKQMKPAFVLWFKKQKLCCPNFTSLCQSTNTRCYINVGFAFLIKKSANDTRL